MKPHFRRIISMMAAAAGLTSASAQELPNIVFIFADDMGYGDVSALNPHARTQTRALDRLARQGITFTEAHASASVCTPSRYGLLTGRYAFRSERGAYGIQGFTGPVIEPEQETIATVLKRAGYTTACIGKWHLGLGWQTREDSGVPRMDSKTGYSNVDYSMRVTPSPNDYGFDYSFIHPASLDIPPYVFVRNGEVIDPDVILTTDHYPARLEKTEYSWDKKHTDHLAVYWEKGVWWRQGEMSRSFRVENCHTEIVREGVAFIENQTRENPEKPFFLYLPLTGPHTPWVPTSDFQGKSNVGLYGDFIMDIDDVAEQLHRTLTRLGIAENTMVIFSSDNGGYWPEEEILLYAHDSNQGRRGQKGDVWDGGHRVPLIISWPARITEPLQYPHLVSLTDFFATFCELTGQLPGKNQGEDSFSFFQVLNGKKQAPLRQSMVHHSSGNLYGIRSGDWKYIQGLGSGGFTQPTRITPEKTGPTGQLYHLREDPMETDNLFFERPDMVMKLKSEMELILKNP